MSAEALVIIVTALMDLRTQQATDPPRLPSVAEHLLSADDMARHKMLMARRTRLVTI